MSRCDATPETVDNLKSDPFLHSLSISNFRNIASASLSFGASLNLIIGNNGSGKTSFLEAVYYLSRLRSFRTIQQAALLRSNTDSFQLIAKISESGQHTIPLGIERTRQSMTVHYNGMPVHRLSDIAGNLPVQILCSETSNALVGGPRRRRQLLDWSLFHVERGYRELWQRYSRALRQRNAALRTRASVRMIRIWDEELADSAASIDRLRREYLQSLASLMADGQTLGPVNTAISFQYSPGWPSSGTFLTALDKGLERDRRMGTTQCGVHRSDFRLSVNQHDLALYASRGQQKSLMVAFLVAQARIQLQRGRSPGVFLLDDLSSELDVQTRSHILSSLKELGAQVFISQIQDDDIDTSAWPSVRKFHVEHGHISVVI